MGVAILITGFGLIAALVGYGTLEVSGHPQWFWFTLVSLVATGAGAMRIVGGAW